MHPPIPGSKKQQRFFHCEAYTLSVWAAVKQKPCFSKAVFFFCKDSPSCQQFFFFKDSSFYHLSVFFSKTLHLVSRSFFQRFFVFITCLFFKASPSFQQSVFFSKTLFFYYLSVFFSKTLHLFRNMFFFQRLFSHLSVFFSKVFFCKTQTEQHWANHKSTGWPSVALSVCRCQSLS